MPLNPTADLVLERLRPEPGELRPEPEDARYVLTNAGRRASVLGPAEGPTREEADSRSEM